MRYVRPSRAADRRPGVVLLVVIAMLALFASVALSFVFYAESVASSAQLGRQAQTQRTVDLDPEQLLAYFLSQLIYDTENVHSSLRGYSLARTMYGHNPFAPNTTPFNGVGRLNYTHTTAPPTLLNQNDKNLVNYQYHPQDLFLRDPEFYGYRTSPATTLNAANYRGLNAPYTYPDLNNMFLATVNADGEVLQQSFYRNWTGVTFNSGDANFLNPIQKYLTLVPHPSYHTQFSVPDADAGGHVKNLDFAKGFKNGATYASNDSFWIDLGFPIMTAPNGTRYKPLFAPLVIDLENRLHLGVTGHPNATAGAPLSNQGYGVNEINLARLIDPTGSNAAELSRIFTQRYGGNTPPDVSANPPPSWPTSAGPPYARVDFNGQNDGNLQLPGSYGTAPNNHFIKPNFPNWYGAGETTSHPLGYDYFADAKKLHPFAMEALLRHKGTNAAAITSELYSKLGLTNALANDRTRNMLTVLGWHFDRVTGSPYLWTPNTPPPPGESWDYKLSGTYPTGLPLPTPSPDSAPGTGTEFSTDFRNTLAYRLRLHLNALANANYPAPSAAGVMDASSPLYSTAVTNRQQVAKNIYDVLVQVTGAKAPPNSNVGTPEYNAARWLAQLAVNIVDYVDADDVMTVFNWDTANNEWAFGTEPPRLVINETYAQIDNNPSDPGLMKGIGKGQGENNNPTMFNLNVWAELHNPLSSDNALFDSGNARLRVFDAASGIDWSAYQLVLSERDNNLRASNNPTGEPTQALETVKDWWDGVDGSKDKQTVVLPAGGIAGDNTQKNVGFYVAGPVDDAILPTHDPRFPRTYPSPRMTHPLQQNEVQRFLNNDGETLTLLLQRLANPYRPHDNNKLNNMTGQPNPNYNPYITVDYVENAKTHDNRLSAGSNLTSFWSVGRKQPYGATSARQRQFSTAGNKPASTFFLHNENTNVNVNTQTLDTPFRWLTHLDRTPVNALELLHVSGYRPHELTQQFLQYTYAEVDAMDRSQGQNATLSGTFKHVAPWEQQDARIYRALELLDVPSRLYGTFPGGREPGRININTLNDIEVWRALCDQRPGFSNFTQADVDQIYSKLIQSRTPNSGIPGQNDRPFKSFATGYDTSGNGLRDTLLRDDPTSTSTPPQKLFQLNSDHPYKNWELLQKIMNNVTFTSNGFAVWVTVGFFEVVDETVQPPKLGKEIGREENRHVRHRMFAIIDRSELAAFRGTGTLSTAVSSRSLQVRVDHDVRLAAGDNHLTLEVTDSTGRSEVVKGTVTVATATTITAGNQLTLTVSPQNLTDGTVQVIARGNPGPQPTFNPRNDPLLVPHFTIIE